MIESKHSWSPKPSLVWNTVRPFYNSHGNIIGAIEVIRDLTDRMLAEESIRKSEERFRSLVDNIPGAVYRCSKDANWTMHYLSDATVDNYGYPPSIISDINELVNAMASAVEEQSISTREIADNIAQVSVGIQEVNEKVNHSSDVAASISKDISLISESNVEVSSSSENVLSSPGDLPSLAEGLQQIVEGFKV